MAIARITTWSSGQTLTASALNAEFNNILNNGVDLWSPASKSTSFGGYALVLDAAGVSNVQSPGTAGFLFTPGAKTGTPGSTGGTVNIAAHTYTDSATAASGTATSWTGSSFQRPTLAASNTSVVTTDAATVYIANGPAAGANQTLTNSWGLWVDDGAVRLDLTTSKASAASAVCRALYLPAATQTISGSTNAIDHSGGTQVAEGGLPWRYDAEGNVVRIAERPPITVEAMVPPITVAPMALRPLAPAPVDKSKGSTPSVKAIEVMTMGRKRSRAA